MRRGDGCNAVAIQKKLLVQLSCLRVVFVMAVMLLFKIGLLRNQKQYI